MFHHHLTIILRNFRRHRGTFFINLIGLTSSLTCVFLIGLWVHDELNFDKFHALDSQLYQVMELSTENGQRTVKDATQGLLATSMAKDLPEVQAATSVMSLEKEGMVTTLRSEDKVDRRGGMFASPNFFQTFSFPLVSGQTANALSAPNSIVISEPVALNLFGNVENAVGKSIDWELMGMKNKAVVSGVFTQPANNSMKFDFVLSYDMFLKDIWTNGQSWNNEGPQTYLVLKSGTDATAFNKKIEGFIRNYYKETQFSLFVRPYSSAYLHGKYEDGEQAGGRIAYVKLFGLIALFILIIACINFMNLSTAKASVRLKEIGIKKAVGSSRSSLVTQFLSEAAFLAGLSMLLSTVLVAVLLPQFNLLNGKELVLRLTPQLLGTMLGVTLFAGLLAGSYPAFYLSKFQPVEVLKGPVKSSISEILARKGLVVFQFVVSIALIFSVAVIYKQIDFIQHKNLGYDKAHVISFDKEGMAVTQRDAFLSELKNVKGIQDAAAMQEDIVQSTNGSTTYGIGWPGKPGDLLVNFSVLAMDYGIPELLGMQTTEGRFFSKEFGDEKSKLVFNETAIKVMGLQNPIGQKVVMWGEEKTIAGVVKDFHLKSLHEPILPTVFRFAPDNTTRIFAKLAPGDEKATISRLQDFYQTTNPGYIFDFSFLDSDFQAQYISEQRVSVLSRYFAGLAILISCLGMFGLATFAAERRTREIGIRKVLGASVGSVVGLLSKEFLALVILSFIIAAPLAYYLMKNWLTDFAYHTEIPWWVFILCGVIGVVLAFLTVSFQSIRVALANPMKALRSE